MVTRRSRSEERRWEQVLALDLAGCSMTGGAAMLAVIESTWFIQASAGSRCISYLAEDGMVTVLSALWLADADREFHRRAKALSLRWAVAETGRPGLPDEVFGRPVESFREAQVRSIAQ